MGRYERMLRDLQERGATVAGVLVEVDDKVQLLGYDNNGMVNFLSDKVQVVAVYERKKGGGITSMASLGSFEDSKSTPTTKPTPEPEIVPEDLQEPEPELDPEAVAKAEEKTLADSLKKGCFDDLD